MRKRLTIATLVLCLTATFLVGITASRSQNGGTSTSSYSAASTSTYDPWVDLNEDGVIDSTDEGIFGVHWASSGDPTKDVYVTNWPVYTDTLVWYDEYLGPSGQLWSDIYSVSGFGHLHLLIAAHPMTGSETIDVTVYGLLWHSEHVGHKAIPALVHTLTSTTDRIAITIPVPSEFFKIKVEASPSTEVDHFSLSFYITWA